MAQAGRLPSAAEARVQTAGRTLEADQKIGEATVELPVADADLHPSLKYDTQGMAATPGARRPPWSSITTTNATVAWNYTRKCEPATAHPEAVSNAHPIRALLLLMLPARGSLAAERVGPTDGGPTKDGGCLLRAEESGTTPRADLSPGPSPDICFTPELASEIPRGEAKRPSIGGADGPIVRLRAGMNTRPSSGDSSLWPRAAPYFSSARMGLNAMSGWRWRCL